MCAKRTRPDRDPAVDHDDQEALEAETAEDTAAEHTPEPEEAGAEDLPADAPAPDTPEPSSSPAEAEPEGDDSDAIDEPDESTEVETLTAALEEARTAAEEARSEAASARQQAEEYLDSLQRERAAFQNYKRRVERERADQAHFATSDMLLRLLPTLDDFYRALEAVPEDEHDQWFEGVALIQRKLERFLADAGVTEIKALGEPFDPNYHEAVSVDPDSDAESGTITEVLQRGYLHGERVLRPAMVRVAE